jgi:hypothetical protein
MSGMRSLLRSTGTWRRKPKRDGGGVPSAKTIRKSQAILAAAQARSLRLPKKEHP